MYMYVSLLPIKYIVLEHQVPKKMTFYFLLLLLQQTRSMSLVVGSVGLLVVYR